MLNYKDHLKNKKTRNFARMTRALLPRNRSAQVGQTVFWLIATLVVIVTLILFIVVSISMSTVKNLNPFSSSALTSDLKGESQILMKKNFLAEELNNLNKDQIEVALK